MADRQQLTSTLIIVPGDVRHAEGIALLSAQLGYPATAAEVQQRLKAIAASSHDIVHVALEDKLVVGWVHTFFTLRLESAPFCEIGGLVVHDGWRGKGIGGMLVEQAKLWCSEKGIRSLRVRSNVVRKEAHGFYVRQGFDEVKKQSVFEMTL